MDHFIHCGVNLPGIGLFQLFRGMQAFFMVLAYQCIVGLIGFWDLVWDGKVPGR